MRMSELWSGAVKEKGYRVTVTLRVVMAAHNPPHLTLKHPLMAEPLRKEAGAVTPRSDRGLEVFGRNPVD